MHRPARRLLPAVAIAITALSCSSEPAPNGATPPAHSGSPPAEPAPEPVLDAAACRDEHTHAWVASLPASCGAKRTCIDPRGRFWVEGRPFFPRGVYNGGWEFSKVLSTCPSGAACSAWNPRDVGGYVRMLADAGFNLIQERSRNTKELVAAIHAEPRMKIAHLLWSDPFTQEGHDAMVADVKAAAADSSVVMWFGPDEIDLNKNYPMAAGIKRILRGASADTDALLAAYPAPSDAVLPTGEPAADPLALPFAAALAFERGLAVGARFYDVLMPITYPFVDEKTAANEGEWGTWRTSKYRAKAPIVPILQMVGIDVMGLAQPSAAQVRVEIASALVHGATGAFYYTLVSDTPKLAGRNGWFAADDREAWRAYTEMHALEDALAPVMFSDAIDTARAGEELDLEWRTWRKADGRRVTLIVNPRAKAKVVDLGSVVELQDGERARTWSDCAAVDTTAELTVPAYGHFVIETSLRR